MSYMQGDESLLLWCAMAQMLLFVAAVMKLGMWYLKIYDLDF